MEKSLCEIWQEVLSVERVGLSDNFFNLGGHSLLATSVVARINQAFNVCLALKTLFSHPTLGDLAQAVSSLNTELDRPALVAVSRDAELQTSFAQQRLWLLDQIDGGSAHYNMPSALKLEGVLNRQALNQTFSAIIERHESLRTCFVAGENGQPVQVIQTASPFEVSVVDLSGLDQCARQLQLNELATGEASRAFDLGADLMLRAQLITMSSDEHVLLVTMHHIASDGWSMSVLVNEFSALYEAYVQGKQSPLAPLAIQYADYANWQRNWLQGDVLEQQLGYWEKQLAGLPIVHSLPLDHPRPAIQTFEGYTHYSHIDVATSDALSELCQSRGATLFMGLHAVFTVLLSRYSNEKDIVVGSPIANREQAEISDLIGFFVNTLVLRSDLSGQPSFTNLLDQSKTTLLDAYSHQQVPFEKIVEHLQPERSLNHSALFQIMLVLQNNEQGSLDLPELNVSSMDQDLLAAKYDLMLDISESAEGLRLGWEYNADLFEQETITRLATHFELLLTALLKVPNENVFAVEMLAEKERNHLLVKLNDTVVEYSKDTCIHELFELQAEKNPDAVAVIFEDQHLTYQQLNKKANQLAHFLIKEKQVKPDALVGICAERSLDMIVGILAILKAGGAYVPLDPEYPEKRLKYMLNDANLTTVLIQSHLRKLTPVSDKLAVCLDDKELQQCFLQQSTQNPSTEKLGLNSSHLAYVIYTSGSTGNPKGVMQVHQTITNLVQGLAIKDGIDRPLKTLQFASTNFDVSIQEIATAWHTGSSLLLLRSETRQNLVALPELLQKEKLERLFLPPAVLHWLVESINEPNTLPDLREIFVAGEELILTAEVMKFLDGHSLCKLWNHYGPTETHVVTRYCANKAQTKVPIGFPIPNTLSVIFNESNSLVPVGIAGELLIGGHGLARGYLNRPDLNAEKFIINPFHDENTSSSNERLYKTGDLARWLPDGSLEFLGRIDHQVKIRGFRIELGEIANTISSYSEVKDVIVIVKESETSSDKRLVAYLSTHSLDFTS